MVTVARRRRGAGGLRAGEVLAEVPRRVEYRLAERGSSLLPHSFGLVEWAQANKASIFEERARH